MRRLSLARSSRPLSRAVALVSVVSFAGSVSSTALAADYGATGPRPVVVKQIEGQGDLEGALAFPETPDPKTPVIVLAHGFASSPQRMVGWGQHLASHGFITLALRNCVGELLCGPDPAVQASLIEKGLAYLRSDAAPAPISENVDATRLLLLGHSAGGQAMVVAANQLRPTALVLFDPVGGDQDPASVEPAKTALSTTCATTLTLFAETHVPDASAGTPSCNKGSSWQAFALASVGPRASAIVVDSTHCDGELPSRIACGTTCGGRADETRQTTYKRHATAFALAALRGDDDAARALGEDFPADPALRDVRIEDGVSCEGAAWPGRAAAADGAAGAGGEAGAGEAPGATDEGCACHAAVQQGEGTFGWLLGAVAFLAALGRKRSRSEKQG
jgi:hypothetical protein